MRKLTFLLILCLPLFGQAKIRDLWVAIDNDVLPQVADGDSWKTSITLVNMDDEPAQYRLQFLQNGGAALPLDIVGLGRVASAAGILPVNGSVVIETAGTSATLSQGFALLDSPNSKNVNGYAIFRQRLPGRTQDFEAVVPFANKYDDDFILPFDNTPGYGTSIAICNPNQYSNAVITVAFHDEAGARFGLDQFVLAPYEHTAYELASRWTVTAGRRGTAAFQVSSGAPVLGLRFNSTGPFTSTHPMSR